MVNPATKFIQKSREPLPQLILHPNSLFRHPFWKQVFPFMWDSQVLAPPQVVVQLWEVSKSPKFRFLPRFLGKGLVSTRQILRYLRFALTAAFHSLKPICDSSSKRHWVDPGLAVEFQELCTQWFGKFNPNYIETTSLHILEKMSTSFHSTQEKYETQPCFSVDRRLDVPLYLCFPDLSRYFSTVSIFLAVLGFQVFRSTPRSRPKIIREFPKA